MKPCQKYDSRRGDNNKIGNKKTLTKYYCSSIDEPSPISIIKSGILRVYGERCPLTGRVCGNPHC